MTGQDTNASGWKDQAFPLMTTPFRLSWRTDHFSIAIISSPSKVTGRPHPRFLSIRKVIYNQFRRLLRGLPKWHTAATYIDVLCIEFHFLNVSKMWVVYTNVTLGVYNLLCSPLLCKVQGLAVTIGYCLMFACVRVCVCKCNCSH